MDRGGERMSGGERLLEVNPPGDAAWILYQSDIIYKIIIVRYPGTDISSFNSVRQNLLCENRYRIIW